VNPSSGNPATFRLSRLLLGSKLLSLPRLFRTMDRGRQMLFVPFFLIAVLFVWALYFVSLRVFGFLLDQGQVGEVLIRQTLTLTLTMIFFLTIMSTTINAISMLFRTRETEWLLAQPLPTLSIFIYKSIEISLYSSWIMLLLAGPIYSALGVVLKLSVSAALHLVLLLVLLIALASVLGVLLGLLLARLLAVSSQLGKFILLIIFLVIGMLLFMPRPQQSGLLPDMQSFTSIQIFMHDLRSSSPYLPGSWVTLSFYAQQEGNPAESCYWLLMLGSTLLMGIEVLLLAANWKYREFWWYIRSADNRQKKHRVTHMGRYPFARQMFALAEKDRKIFLRSPSQWIQTLMLLGTFTFLVFILRQVPERFAAMEALYATILTYISFMAVGYFFTTIALRFLYPALSLEGKSFWFLLAAPIQRANLLVSKLAPLLITMLGAALLVSRYVGRLLNQPAEIMQLTLTATLAAVSVIVMLTFAVGTIWMNIKENDPAKLSSGIPAIITTMIIFGYLLLVVMALAVPFDSYFQALLANGYYDASLAASATSLIVGSALAADLILWFTCQHMFARKDF